MPIPKSYKTKETAAYLGISRDALEALVRQGQIARFKLGGLWFYNERDLDEYYRKQRQNGIKTAAELRECGKKPVKLKQRQRSQPTIEEILSVWH